MSQYLVSQPLSQPGGTGSAFQTVGPNSPDKQGQPSLSDTYLSCFLLKCVPRLRVLPRYFLCLGLLPPTKAPLPS